jgi:hypothetical protein
MDNTFSLLNDEDLKSLSRATETTPRLSISDFQMISSVTPAIEADRSKLWILFSSPEIVPACAEIDINAQTRIGGSSDRLHFLMFAFSFFNPFKNIWNARLFYFSHPIDYRFSTIIPQLLA